MRLIYINVLVLAFVIACFWTVFELWHLHEQPGFLDFYFAAGFRLISVVGIAFPMGLLTGRSASRIS